MHSGEIAEETARSVIPLEERWQREVGCYLPPILPGCNPPSEGSTWEAQIATLIAGNYRTHRKMSQDECDRSLRQIRCQTGNQDSQMTTHKLDVVLLF